MRPLNDIGLAKNPFEAEPVALRGAARWRIQRIHFHSLAAIARLVEHAPHHQKHRLAAGGACRCSAGEWCDAADLDDYRPAGLMFRYDSLTPTAFPLAAPITA